VVVAGVVTGVAAGVVSEGVGAGVVPSGVVTFGVGVGVVAVGVSAHPKSPRHRISAKARRIMRHSLLLKIDFIEKSLLFDVYTFSM
jgi:hypothetical protein